MKTANIAKYTLAIGLFTLVLGAMLWLRVDEVVQKDTAGFASQSDWSESSVSQRKRRMRGELKMSEPDLFSEFHRSIRTKLGASAPAYQPNYRLDALQKARTHRGLGRVGAKQSASTPLPWIERGPVNVAGRARAILVDPDDSTQRTWFVGTASGGVWKTEDAGVTWRELTRDLPNLATTTLAMPASNPNIIYAGTGEGFGSFAFVYGQGIWKSEDKGETWTQLPATSNNPAFTNTLRVIVDPNDASNLMAATSTGIRDGEAEVSYIMKSEDGGASWTETYQTDARVEQVVSSLDDFSVLYATVNGRGVLKSTDAGATWTENFSPFYNVGRIELAIAPSDPSRIYASAEAGFIEPMFIDANVFQATLFRSSDAGETWDIVSNFNESPPNWMGNLGWYSNSVAVHPTDPDRVFAGGVDIYQFEIGTTMYQTGIVKDAFLTDPTNYYEFFLAIEAPPAGPKVGRQPGITSDEYIEVEVRWGPDKKQRAHRFEEKWLTAYQDYTDVEFEVWDVKNNRQLMVAYEDEDKDGRWDLLDGLNDASERMLVTDITYDPSGPDELTTQNVFSRAMYVVKIRNTEDEALSHGPFPEGTLHIIPEIRTHHEATITRVTDGYSENPVASKGVHVDHHQLLVIPSNSGGLPMLLDANDGGIAVSYDLGESFTQTGDTFAQLLGGAGTSSRPFGGLNTAQFYGVDKMNGADRYVGGTQDNGSWTSPHLATNTEPWSLGQSGDGFEAIWHYTNTDWIMQSAQFNTIYRSQDGGQTWSEVSPRGARVFVTRLANNNKRPDLVLSATPDGVVRSEDFGTTWERILLPAVWPSSPSVAIAISEANPDIVWTGAAIDENVPVYVSRNAGVDFEPVAGAGVGNLGTITNLVTHPNDENTAYALLSQANASKILRTTDLGATWEDISGFGAGKESDNGFPDVAVYSLLVMPFDDQIIWAGTEIGIFESTDGGVSWKISDSGFPSVAVWQIRIVNDQVVVGTHGRGVWTVQLPQLAGYEPTDLMLSPVIAQTTGGANGLVMLDVQLRAAYDSTRILMGGTPIASIPANTAADTVQLTLDLTRSGSEPAGEETILLTAQGYSAGNVVTSATQNVVVFGLEPAADEFATDFEEVGDAFVMDGFSIRREEGFNNKAMHSAHPYPDFGEATSLLRTPIIIDETDALLEFHEIVLVEAGEDNALFGTDKFYDYVIVEGSSDMGLTWTALEEGYDVRRDPSWAAIELQEVPQASYFVNHEIDLAATFASGEVVLIRFRMHSDNAVTGWGWVIDNLRVQSSLPVSNEDEAGLPDDYTLLPNYPNPFADQTTIRYALPEPANVSVSIFDVNGRLIQHLMIDQQQPAGRYAVQWNGKTLWGGEASSGVYFYRLDAGNAFQETRRLVRVR